jgi:hypothetical protein
MVIFVMKSDWRKALYIPSLELRLATVPITNEIHTNVHTFEIYNVNNPMLYI